VDAEVRARDASPETLAYLKEYDALAALFYAGRGTAAAALEAGAAATDAYAGALEAEAAMLEIFLDACEPGRRRRRRRRRRRQAARAAPRPRTRPRSRASPPRLHCERDRAAPSPYCTQSKNIKGY
jgi:hypothetical protein